MGAADKLPLITGWSKLKPSTALAPKLFGPCERDNGYHQHRRTNLERLDGLDNFGFRSDTLNRCNFNPRQY